MDRGVIMCNSRNSRRREEVHKSFSGIFNKTKCTITGHKMMPPLVNNIPNQGSVSFKSENSGLWGNVTTSPIDRIDNYGF